MVSLPTARSLRLAAALAAAPACLACAPPPRVDSPSPAASAILVAVLRPTWATPSPPFDVAPAALLRGLADNGGLRPELTGTDGACAETPGCVIDTFSSSPFAHVLVVRLAALGDTVLVRATLIDPRRGTEEAARQVVVQNATAPRVEASLLSLGQDIASPFAPPRPPPPSVARSAWFWVAIAGGAAVAGAAIGAAVWASEPRPDGVISPP